MHLLRNSIVLALVSGWISLEGTFGAEPKGLEAHPLVGMYEDRFGRLWTVADTRGEAGKLSLGMPDGEVRALTETADRKFTFGPAFLLGTPVEGRVSFGVDGETMTVEQGPKNMEAKRRRFREREVWFQNGEVKLAGTMIVPDGEGPFPAVVDVHGSGPATRHLGRAYGEALVRQGYASLAYDKRGVGKSGGDFASATLDDLAGDAVAATRFLSTQPEIDAKRIGLWGHSQGGWVGVKAARENTGISYLIVRSGPATSPAREGIFEEECRLRFQGYSEAQVREAVRLMRLNHEVTRGNAEWRALQEAVEKLKEEKWFSRWGFNPSGPDSSSRRKYGLDMDYDPSAELKELKIPSLWLFGGLDMSIPVQESIALLTGLATREGKGIDIELFPRANHAFFEARTGADEEIPRLKRLVNPLPVIEKWLEDRVVGRGVKNGE